MVLLSEQQMHFVIGFNYNYDFVCFGGVFQVFFNPRTPGGFGRTPTPGGVDFPPPYDLENYAG